MTFCYSHLTRNIFNLHMRRFFFGLVYNRQCLLKIQLMNQKHLRYKPVHEISNNLVCATSKASDQPAHTRSLIRAFASRMNIL